MLVPGAQITPNDRFPDRSWVRVPVGALSSLDTDQLAAKILEALPPGTIAAYIEAVIPREPSTGPFAPRPPLSPALPPPAVKPPERPLITVPPEVLPPSGEPLDRGVVHDLFAGEFLGRLEDAGIEADPDRIEEIIDDAIDDFGGEIYEGDVEDFGLDVWDRIEDEYPYPEESEDSYDDWVYDLYDTPDDEEGTP